MTRTLHGVADLPLIGTTAMTKFNSALFVAVAIAAMGALTHPAAAIEYPWCAQYSGRGGGGLKIPLISDEAINIGKSWLFEEELTELFHERPQAILPHGRDELIMQAALAEQRMDTSLGCAGL